MILHHTVLHAACFNPRPLNRSPILSFMIMVSSSHADRAVLFCRYQPRHNIMVSSEFGTPNAFFTGFDPAVANTEYGR
jgi:hypothetical protein